MSKSSFASARLVLGPLVPLVMLAGGVGCASEEVGSDHGTRPEDQEKISQTHEAMTKDEIIARAEAYVAASVPYCGGVRGGTDYICGGTCSRPAAAWDAYRSDCSGFVSWCWQIASDPTTSVYMSDRSGTNGWSSIPLDSLEAGDALVCDGHIKLFGKKVSATSYEIYEEYNCGHVGRKATQTFTRTGDTLKFAYDSRVYHAIRRNGLTPSVPPVQLKGYLDSANTSLTGWAVDMNAKSTALTIDFWIDGDPGKGTHLSAKADVARPDVATALGVDPNHGFSLTTPLYFCDAKAHAIHALANPVDKSGGVALGGSVTALNCPIPKALPGVLRWIESPTVLGAWKFDPLKEQRWMTPDDETAYEKSGSLPSAPTLRKTPDGAIWVIDSGTRRHVVSPASFTAWAFDDKAVTAMTDAEAATVAEGLPLPEAPVLVQATSGPKVYVLDVKPASLPPGSDGGPGGGDDGGTTGDTGSTPPGVDAGPNGTPPTNQIDGGNDMKGGCSVPNAPKGSSPWAFALVTGAIAAWAARRRRSA